MDKVILDAEKNLGQFIVGDLVGILEKQGFLDFEGALSKTTSFISKKAKRYQLIRYFDKMYNFIISFLPKKHKSKPSIFFRNIRFPHFILKTKESYPTGLIVSGIKDRLFAIRNLLPYFSVSDLYELVEKYLDTRDEKYLQELVKKIEERLKKERPKYVILWNDCFPIERAIALASKKLKIPTIQIQVGMYNSMYAPDNGRVADYVFVWGEFFRKLYLKYNLRTPKNTFVLGYPKKFEKLQKNTEIRQKYKVVYFGQAFMEFNKKLGWKQIETIKKLGKLCKEIELEFVYRPHPKEDREELRKQLLGIKLTKKDETMNESLVSGDIFISLFSTALIEAAMHSQVCIQLEKPNFRVGNFEELGICKTINNFNELKKYLFRLKDSKLKTYKYNFNRKYVHIPKDINKEFSNILEDIING
jgi:hypothetical protein